MSLPGYGGAEFGSSFTSALSTFGGDTFNSVSVSDCFKDLALRGCYLSRNTDGPPFQIKEGIPYKLTLSFNRYDKLTDIGLSYDREEDIAKSECLSIHERTLDWLVGEFGPLRFPKGEKAGKEARKTSAGNAYEIWQNDDGSFVTSPMRTVASAVPSILEKRPIPDWDQERYVSLLSHFIIVNGKPMCSVGVDFSEPKSVERPKLD